MVNPRVYNYLNGRRMIPNAKKILDYIVKEFKQAEDGTILDNETIRKTFEKARKELKIPRAEFVDISLFCKGFMNCSSVRTYLEDKLGIVKPYETPVNRMDLATVDFTDSREMALLEDNIDEDD